MQDTKHQISYADIFPDTFKMMNTLLVLTIGTVSVERLFSHLKMMKTMLCSSLSDWCSTAYDDMIEGPEIDAVEFEEILDILNEHNHRILL